MIRGSWQIDETTGEVVQTRTAEEVAFEREARGERARVELLRDRPAFRGVTDGVR